MKKALTVLSALTILFAGAALARPSQPSEFRGFETCIDAAKAEFTSGFVSNRTYFIDREGADNVYFINASALQAGDREPLMITCETSRNGRKLLAYSAAPGRFIPQRGNVRIDVAGK
ncbi:MAG: hypothetical protein O7F71_14155 [Gammaproteobacteria bacterium]|nr:hypothetical protein [Gammaproteobacteria bacterium]